MIVNTLYPPLQVGGAEKSVSLLAEALVRSGEEVSVVSLHPSHRVEVDERNGVRVYRLPLANLYWPFDPRSRPGAFRRLLWHLFDIWNWRMARAVGRVLDAEAPDVVHTNNLAGFSVAVLREVKKRRIRLVHTLRDYYMICDRYALFKNGAICDQRCRNCKVLTSNRRLMSQTVDAVVSNSEYVLKAHRQHGWFMEVPAAVIYNIAEASPPHAPRIAEESGKPGLTFGYIGKIVEDKGIEVVLAATRLLARANWRLKIAGLGLEPYVAGLRRRFPDPRIEWVGFAEAGKFYPSIDVSLIASVWAEPLPRTLIESFAAGKSAICARSGGILEISSLGKVVDTYFAGDASALAARMDAALANPAPWREGGWRDPAAFEMFSEAAVMGRYRDVYRGVALSEVSRSPDLKFSSSEVCRADRVSS